MDATTLFIVVVAGAVVVLGAGVFAVAFRRTSTPAGSPEALIGTLDKRAVRADRAANEARTATATTATAVAVMEPEAEATAGTAQPAVEPATEDPGPDEPVLERQVVTAQEYGVTRRKFFNRAIFGLFGVAFLGGLTLSILAFLWPKLKGTFGTAIVAGDFNELFEQTQNPDGTTSPVFIAAAQAYIVPFPPPQKEGSSFEGLPVIGVTSGEIGLMALWQKCVHLGCRVPSCESSQGFECPCHGSKYNYHGEYEGGPAPRNLDHFGVEIDADGQLVVLTGDVFETPRAKNKTIKYPQGPTCL